MRDRTDGAGSWGLAYRADQRVMRALAAHGLLPLVLATANVLNQIECLRRLKFEFLNYLLVRSTKVDQVADVAHQL